jgi:hypothetical protein
MIQHGDYLEDATRDAKQPYFRHGRPWFDDVLLDGNGQWTKASLNHLVKQWHSIDSVITSMEINNFSYG